MNLFGNSSFKCHGFWFLRQASLLSFLLMLSFAAHAQSITGTTGAGLIYSASSGQVTVTGYDDLNPVLSIPSTIDVSGTTLPVSSIADSAFYNCTTLASVTIPSSVISVSNDALAAVNMAVITVDLANPVYSSVNGVFFDKAQTALLQYPAAKAGSRYTIPNGVTSVGYDAFLDCYNLINITIPTTVTSLGDYAFFQDLNLTGITLPSGLTHIGEGTFDQCSNLTSITIPAGVTSIGNYAFMDCSRLASAVFMGSAPTSFGTHVFSGVATGFNVYYFNGAAGFTSPTWQSYPSVNMGAYSSAAPWLVSNGLAYNAALQSTPNHDGIPLLMSYALGFDPTKNQSSRVPKPVVSGGLMSLTYYAGNADVTYSVEASNNLQSWSISGVTVSAPDANLFRTATVPLSGSKCFMRIKFGY